MNRLFDICNVFRGNMEKNDYKIVIFSFLQLYLSLNSQHKKEIIKSKNSNNIKKIISKFASKYSDKKKYDYSSLINLSITDTIYQEAFTKMIDYFEDESFNKKNDNLGNFYEYFLEEFERLDSGEHYTPRCVVELLTRSLDIKNGKIYDPCTGSGGMFVISQQNCKNKLEFFGQELSKKTRELCILNCNANNLKFSVGKKPANIFSEDLHENLKVDFALANPPFNQKDWDYKKNYKSKKWSLGIPPKKNANFAWLQNIFYHLNNNGRAGIVLANGSLTSGNNLKNEEYFIRKSLIEHDLIESIVSLPPGLFFNTQIPVTLWFLNKNKIKNKNKILMIYANGKEKKFTRKNNILDEFAVNLISKKIVSFRNSNKDLNEFGFSKIVSNKDIEQRNYKLNPGRYVGVKIRIEKTNLDFNQLKKIINDKTITIKEYINI